MDAYVSGVAARIVYVQGNDVSYIEAEEPATRITSSIAKLPELLADAYDVELLKGVEESEALVCLLGKWNEDRALRMLQVVIDRDAKLSERAEAAAYLAALLQEPTADSVANWAYAIPLTSPLEDEEIQAICADSGKALEFVQRLNQDQPKVVQFRRLWDRIDDGLFSDMYAKREFELQAIKRGAFRLLARATSDAAVKDAIFECHVRLADQPNVRSIIGDWTKGLLTPRARKQVEREVEVPEDGEAGSHTHRYQRNIPTTHQAYSAVTKQKDSIRQLLEVGDIARARKFMNQLVRKQVESGDSNFAAMSLCSLAQEAKRLGQYSLQLEWVSRAIDVAPDDAWSQGQAADAYVMLYRLDEARRAYETVGRLGDVHFAMGGIARVYRASGQLDAALQKYEEMRQKFPEHPQASRDWSGYGEVLRDMWRFEAALEAYTEATEKFPGEPVLWCGLAATLKDMGDLQAAKRAYADTIERFPEQVVAYSGYADVLKNMGELDAALEAYDAAIGQFPNEAVALCGKADALRTVGRLHDAEAAYAVAKERFPYEPAAFSGYAETLRDSGNLGTAAEAYEAAARQFPYEVRIRNGRANVLKVAGKFNEALQAYERNIRDFPYDLFSLSGRANLLKELGHYTEALAAFDLIMSRRSDYQSARCSKASVFVILGKFDEAEKLLPDEHVRTLSGWVAQHIRGMIQLKKGNLDTALDIFENGFRLNPFYKQRRYFKNALAVTKMRLLKYSEAIEVVEDLDDDISNIVMIHSFGAMGWRDLAQEAYKRARETSPPPIVSLRDEIAARYGLLSRKPAHNDDWIAERETDVILEAA